MAVCKYGRGKAAPHPDMTWEALCDDLKIHPAIQDPADMDKISKQVRKDFGAFEDMGDLLAVVKPTKEQIEEALVVALGLESRAAPAVAGWVLLLSRVFGDEAQLYTFAQPNATTHSEEYKSTPRLFRPKSSCLDRAGIGAELGCDLCSIKISDTDVWRSQLQLLDVPLQGTCLVGQTAATALGRLAKKMVCTDPAVNGNTYGDDQLW